MELKPGDLFATNGSGLLPLVIRAVEWFWSTDNSVTYNHVGVYFGPEIVKRFLRKLRLLRTLEARWRFGFYDLTDYIGRPVLIVRHKAMTRYRFLFGFIAVRRNIGCFYPLWRLPLHLFRVAKFFAFGPGVCSEQTGKFMAGAGFKNIVYGLTPDDLADRWKIDKDMEIVFEGVLTEDILNK